MAKIVGQSGAWSAIVAELAARNCVVHRPSDLAPMADILQSTRDSDVALHRAETSRAVQDRCARIEALAAERGLFKRLTNATSIRTLRAEIARLYEVDARFVSRLDERIARVLHLSHSAELAGAEAELAVVGELERLPDYYSVYNDVRLVADRHIRFDGAPLQSAQVDHVVIGPGGVFVIETKCWSRQFATAGHYHDPFDQSARASYLCYDLLKAHRPLHVRQVIVSAGSLPPAPNGSHAAVVRPEAIYRYVKSFSPQLLPGQLESLDRFFGQRVGSSGGSLTSAST